MEALGEDQVVHELLREDKDKLRSHKAYLEAKEANAARRAAWEKEKREEHERKGYYPSYDYENDIPTDGLERDPKLPGWLMRDFSPRLEFADMEDITYWELESSGLPEEGRLDWDAIEATAGYPYIRAERDEIRTRFEQEADRVYKHKFTGELVKFRVSPTDPVHGWSPRYGWNGAPYYHLSRLWIRDNPLPTWLSHRHKALRIQSMEPWPYNHPISLEGQKTLLEEARKLVAVEKLLAHVMSPFVMLGPPGCSKTAIAGAVLLEFFTVRWVQHHHTEASYKERQAWKPMHDRGTYGIYRVSVREWLAKWHDYKTRNLKSKVKKPAVTAQRIKRDAKENRAFPPILWLEEVDSFTMTEEKLGLVLSLIDTVYELGGMIVLTSNATPKQLREMFDSVRPGIYRRLTGECDGPGATFWNLHACAKKHPAKVIKADTVSSKLEAKNGSPA